MPGIFNELIVTFPTTKGMSKRERTLRKTINGTLEYIRVTGASIDLIVEEAFHARLFTHNVVKGVHETFPQAVIQFADSTDYKGTRRTFNPSLL